MEIAPNKSSKGQAGRSSGVGEGKIRGRSAEELAAELAQAEENAARAARIASANAAASEEEWAKEIAMANDYHKRKVDRRESKVGRLLLSEVAVHLACCVVRAARGQHTERFLHITRIAVGSNADWKAAYAR